MEQEMALRAFHFKNVHTTCEQNTINIAVSATFLSLLEKKVDFGAPILLSYQSKEYIEIAALFLAPYGSSFKFM